MQITTTNLRNGYLNQNLCSYGGVGAFDIPPLESVDVPMTKETRFVRFDMAFHESHPEKEICHFFTSDSVFERVWRNPERYVSMLSRFKAVVAPDFSIYTDFPLSCQIFNHFRKHWMGRFLHERGITVIPCIRWGMGNPESYSWCFDGEPIGSTICISTHGAIKGKERKKMFLDGWREAIERLKPSRIYLYGDMFPGLDFCGEIIHVDNEVMAKKRRYRHGDR